MPQREQRLAQIDAQPSRSGLERQCPPQRLRRFSMLAGAPLSESQPIPGVEQAGVARQSLTVVFRRQAQLIRVVETIGLGQPGAGVGGGARRGHSGGRCQHRENLPRDLVDVGHAIDLAQIPLCRVVR